MRYKAQPSQVKSFIAPARQRVSQTNHLYMFIPKLSHKTKLNIYKAGMLLGVASIIFLVLLSGYQILRWFDTWKMDFQSPIRNFIIITPRETSVKHSVIKEAEAAKPDMDEILTKVYTLESTGGKNDGCTRKGQFNGYGYAQNKSSWICFDTHTHVTERVATWFANHLKELDLSTALCFYNTGYKVNNCTYYQNYLKLK